nr:Ring domain containing protein [Pandoravirus aubagnensis]
MASTRQSAQADSGELTRHPAQDVQHDTKTRHAHNKQRVRPHRTTPQQSDAAIVSAIAAIDTRGDRRLADCAANISIEAWVQRVRGATLPPWTAGIDIVDLTHVPRPDPRDHSCVGARLTLFWAQWGDGEAARQLCDMAQDICSTDTRQWHLAPAQLRRDVALWHPIVAHANNISVRVFVPVLAEIMANAAGDGPTCVVCMCEPPAMVIEPCGHLCLCADDWQHLVQGPRRSLKCPLCRSPADAAWRVRSLFAHDEPAIEKPTVGMSGPPDLSADPQRGDVEIDFASIVNDPARSLELIRLLTIYRLLTGEIEPGAISGSRYGGFTYFNTATYVSRQQDRTIDNDNVAYEESICVWGGGGMATGIDLANQTKDKAAAMAVAVATTVLLRAAVATTTMMTTGYQASLKTATAAAIAMMMTARMTTLNQQGRPLLGWNRPVCPLQATTLNSSPRRPACLTTLPLTRSWPPRAISLRPSKHSVDCLLLCGPLSLSLSLSLFSPLCTKNIPSFFLVFLHFVAKRKRDIGQILCTQKEIHPMPLAH